MSLINDALKRAKAVQQAAPPPLEQTLHLRPAEPEATVRHGIGYATPIAFAAIALLVLFFVWRFAQQRGSNGAQTPGQGSHQAQTEPAATPSDSTPVRARAREQQTELVPATAAASPTPANPAAVTPGSTTAASNVTQIVSPGEPVTNVAVAMPVAPPPLKLQGVVFNPRRPSAVISGKTVFVGERVGTMRVSAIRVDSVTLIGGGKTNVLTMEE